MRRHPQIGAQLLQSVGGIWAYTAPLVQAHHERWDGQGYPEGKAGEAIIPGARMLAIVDAYVAMTESRPYRQALTPAEARAEIQRCAGSAFDPHIATVFLQILERNNRMDASFKHMVRLPLEASRPHNTSFEITASQGA